jgi:hypothetical protein
MLAHAGQKPTTDDSQMNVFVRRKGLSHFNSAFSAIREPGTLTETH